ncbi:hypothetical protein N7527_010465 [Penicillium freii]|nr:hypothetical protein N7527_010465 [Penicillium freii]
MFLSRLLTPAEKNYWATELEVSCITWTIKKVRHLIETAKKHVIFYTDHSATIAVATSLKTSSTERLNLRLVRGSMYMQQFPIKVFHRPRKTNRIADALSRLPSVSPTLPKQDDDLEALTGQALIADLLNFRTSRSFAYSSLLQPTSFSRKFSSPSNLLRPLVPPPVRKRTMPSPRSPEKFIGQPVKYDTWDASIRAKLAMEDPPSEIL